ncbi:unnamed protein product, partial [Brassica rapa subsp. narinosa]
LGDGRSASYWFDNWSHHGPLIEFIGFDGPMKMGINIKATVAEGCGQSGWLLPSARCRNEPISHLRGTLLLLQPPVAVSGSDTFTWGTEGNRSSVFSTKKTWNFLRPSAPKVNWKKVVWFKFAVPKHAFHFWICNLDRLPLKTRMALWNPAIDPSCSLCGQSAETRDHLFLQCSVSTQVWSQLLQRLGQTGFTLNSWQDLMQWLLSPPHGLSRTLNRLAVQALISILWRERNGRIHNGTTQPPSVLFKSLDRQIRDTLLARLSHGRCQGLLSLWFQYE